MRHKGNGVITGTLLLAAGTLIGAGAAIMLSPRSGREMRNGLYRYARKAVRGAGGVVEEFSDSVSGMIDSVGDRAEDILDRSKDLTRDAKKEVIGVIEEGRKKLEKQRVKLEKLIA